MRRILGPIVLVLLLLGTGWLVLGGGEVSRAGAEAGGARAQVVEVERRAAEEAPAKAKAEPGRARSKDERELLRRKIVESLASRERAAAEQRAAARDDDASSAGRRAKRGGGTPVEEAPPAGGLVDRGGKHGYLLKVMNEELMPMVDECYQLARATRPELAGMLVLDAEILGDEEIGGVVESIATGRDNELSDPTLDECVRESLLSMTLPPPPTGGRDAISLSLRLEPEPPK